MRITQAVTRLSRRQTALAVASIAAGVTAIWVAQRARRAEREHPPAGAYIEVDGVRLHYVARGSGPAVVLLHGNLVSMHDITTSKLVDELARSHRVILFDRPGFGFSERPRNRLWTARAQAELIDRALAQLGIDDAIVVGHSWGALVAVEMALTNALAVRKLVLVSGYFFPDIRLDVPLAAPAAIPVLGDILRFTLTPVFARLLLERTIRKMFAPEKVPTDYVEQMPREMAVRPSQIRAQAEDAAFMIPAAQRICGRLERLGVPIVLFAGAEDRVIDPHEQSERLHRMLPSSRLELVPGAGHMVHHAHYREILDAITEPSTEADAAATIRPAA